MSTVCVGLMVLAAGCNHDGRYLRPATPDQNATISTTAAPSTTAAGIFGAPDSATDDAAGTIDASGTDDPSATGDADVSTTTAALAAVAPWRDGALIDARYTCDGLNISPPLSWPAAPAGTVEIAITLGDEQLPTFIHWVAAGIDPTVTSVTESALPDGAIEGVNGNGTTGYTGPCPPKGETHTYQLTVHYLGLRIELADGAAGADMLAAIQSNTIATAVTTGTYTRA
jgi:Raf kinase inhibitor-like YbhB/YbcL family protein